MIKDDSLDVSVKDFNFKGNKLKMRNREHMVHPAWQIVGIQSCKCGDIHMF